MRTTFPTPDLPPTEATPDARRATAPATPAPATAAEAWLQADLSPYAKLAALRRNLSEGTPSQRIALLRGLRSQMPPDAFLWLLAELRGCMPAAQWTPALQAVGAPAWMAAAR